MSTTPSSARGKSTAPLTDLDTPARMVFLTFQLVCRRWFCHVDDDNYLNVGALLKLLSHYSHNQDVYVGRPSLERPIQAAERTSTGQMVRGPIDSCFVGDGSHSQGDH